MTRRGTALLSLVGAVASATTAFAQPTYTVIDIKPTSGLLITASDINDSGLVVGTDTDADFNDHPFTWQDGSFSYLSLPDGTARAAAKQVSEDGLIVGWASPAGVFLPRAVVWDQGQRADIGTLGGDDAGAMGVSPDGSIVVGWARPTAGDVPGGIGFRGFSWEGSAMRDLGTLPVGHWSQANDANDAGQIVGGSGSKNDSTQAALYDPEQGVIHLGSLGGLGSYARAINAAGAVVGESGTGTVLNGRMASHAFVWEDGAMTDLGVLPGDHTSWGMDLNDAGVAVGMSINTSEIPWIWSGFIWIDGQMWDLNDLIPSGSGWTIVGAAAINNNGWIVGEAERAGVKHAVLLKPQP